MDLVAIDLLTLKAERLRALPTAFPSEGFATLLDGRLRSTGPSVPEHERTAEPEPIETATRDGTDDDVSEPSPREPDPDANVAEAPPVPEDDGARDFGRDGHGGNGPPTPSEPTQAQTPASVAATPAAAGAVAADATDAARAVARPAGSPLAPPQIITAPSLPNVGLTGGAPQATPATASEGGGAPGRTAAGERPSALALQRPYLHPFTGAATQVSRESAQRSTPIGKAAKHSAVARGATNVKAATGHQTAAAGPAEAGRAFALPAGGRASSFAGARAYGPRGPLAQAPGLHSTSIGLTPPKVPGLEFAANLPRPAAAAGAAADQVAVHIRKAAVQGQERISIKLHPAELGRVEVKLEWRDDGLMRVVISAEKTETLELLQRDARALERALQDAGLKTDSGSLSFNLRGHGGRGDDAEHRGAEHSGAHATTAAGDAQAEGAAGWRALHHGLVDLSV